jgi:hypothetical protein
MGNILQHVKRAFVHFNFRNRPYAALCTDNAQAETPFLLDIIDDLCPEDECVILDFGLTANDYPYIPPNVSAGAKTCSSSYETLPDTSKTEIDYTVRPLVLKSQKPQNIDIDLINNSLSNSPLQNPQNPQKTDTDPANSYLSKSPLDLTISSTLVEGV